MAKSTPALDQSQDRESALIFKTTFCPLIQGGHGKASRPHALRKNKGPGLGLTIDAYSL
jgi:hypothetical protein